ncbi:MAG: hypothetical protein NVSMB32_01850 [Actinomycetota bacterium]
MRKILIAIVVLVVLAGGGAFWYVQHRPLNTPRQALTAYLQRWHAQDWPGMRALVFNPPDSYIQIHSQMVKELGVDGVTVTAGSLQVTGTARSAPLTVALHLKTLGPWSYPAAIRLVQDKRRWKVAWTPATLHPQLKAGEKFALSAMWDRRAPILGRDGGVLEASTPATQIGVEPAKITDMQAVLNAFQQYANVPTATVTKILTAPGVQPTWFLPVLTVPTDQFSSLKPKLAPVAGILFQQASIRLPAKNGFALPVLGTTGAVSADRLAQLGPPYTSASVVGTSGLEQAYERQLAGTPSSDIQLVDATGTVLTALFHVAGVAPQAVQTTLDPTIQAAAEGTFAGVPQAAALVALDAATGEVRAVVNRPASGFDRAITGSYPPGSTFKIVTTAALLAKGMDLSSPISCPTSVAIDGRTFKNFEGETLGNITLADAFSHSCNTAYVQMAATLKPAELSAAALNFGFNTPEPLGLTSAGGSFPPPKDLAAQLAASIGQADVVASPLHMASVAAAVASGEWHQPTLVAGASATATVRPLDPNVAAKLRTAMGLVVAQGTGTAAQLPGTPVAGKTGTAEFGSGNPPATHAWFVGFRGPIAFAVVVEGGGVGGRVAAPLAAKFLSAFPG